MIDFRFRVPSSPVIPHEPLRDTTGLVGTFALDLYRENDIHKLCRFFDRKQRHAGTNRRTRPDRRWKTHAIQSVVDAYADSLPDPNRLSGKIANQRKREKTVSDGAAEGRLTRRSLRVDVYPLPIFGRVGELLDAVLGQHQPIRRGQFASFEFF